MYTVIKIMLCGALALLPALQCADASTLNVASGAAPSLLYSGSMPGSRLVQGSSAIVTTIQVAEAGTLSFILTDEVFPATLSGLSFSVTNADASLGTMTGPGTMSMAISGPMTLYADVFATTQGTASLGLYNLQISFLADDDDEDDVTPVPLPPSGPLLGGFLGLLLFGDWIRRGRTRTRHALLGQISV